MRVAKNIVTIGMKALSCTSAGLHEATCRYMSGMQRCFLAKLYTSDTSGLNTSIVNWLHLEAAEVERSHPLLEERYPEMYGMLWRRRSRWVHRGPFFFFLFCGGVFGFGGKFLAFFFFLPYKNCQAPFFFLDTESIQRI